MKTRTEDDKETFRPVETEVGIISGRNAIYLDKITFEKNMRSITLEGELNSTLCSSVKTEKEYIPYDITFTNVQYLSKCELDFYGYERGYKSSFDEVLNSTLLKLFKQRDSASKLEKTHKHFIFATYDDVFELVATGFELKIQK